MDSVGDSGFVEEMMEGYIYSYLDVGLSSLSRPLTSIWPVLLSFEGSECGSSRSTRVPLRPKF